MSRTKKTQNPQDSRNETRHENEDNATTLTTHITIMKPVSSSEFMLLAIGTVVMPVIVISDAVPLAVAVAVAVTGAVPLLTAVIVSIVVPVELPLIVGVVPVHGAVVIVVVVVVVVGVVVVDGGVVVAGGAMHASLRPQTKRYSNRETTSSTNNFAKHELRERAHIRSGAPTHTHTRSRAHAPAPRRRSLGRRR